MNRDRRDIHQDDSKEWGQGFIGTFESGYTQGTVGFGLDVNAMLGLKLDGGGGTDGSSILPYGSGNGKAPGSFSTAGGTLKLRAFDTELKAGDLFLNNPVIAGGMTSMLPQTFRGVSLTNHSFDGWMIEGGRPVLPSSTTRAAIGASAPATARCPPTPTASTWTGLVCRSARLRG